MMTHEGDPSGAAAWAIGAIGSISRKV